MRSPLMVLFTLSAGATFIVSDWFERFGGFSIQNALANIGFDDQDRSGSTLSAVRIPEPGRFVRGQYYYPINFGHMNAGHAHWGGFAVTIGVQLGELAPERTHQPTYEPTYAPQPAYAPPTTPAYAPPPAPTPHVTPAAPLTPTTYDAPTPPAQVPAVFDEDK
ncbi:MAG: hypothetical protein KF901_03590 [Myxococcales bacterium]|nr:hypothetical protein [Myxococcales bacterium]